MVALLRVYVAGSGLVLRCSVAGTVLDSGVGVLNVVIEASVEARVELVTVPVRVRSTGVTSLGSTCTTQGICLRDPS